MQEIVRRIDAFTDKLGHWTAWLTLALVLVTGLIVLLRYAFQIGSIALQESIMYLNALIFTMGAAYTLKEQGHVRVDVFYNRLNDRGRLLVDVAGCMLFLFVSCGFILWASWDYVAVAWRVREGSAESSGLPFVYLLKSCLLLLPFLLVVQGVAELLRATRRLADRRSGPGNPQPASGGD
ncbi:MAG: TRAP transporter small permease subunit [Gammaproteobacteria bacterium]|nr:TRAP transporter small permease subunit [Gammaproteobacteria bacterium]